MYRGLSSKTGILQSKQLEFQQTNMKNKFTKKVSQKLKACRSKKKINDLRIKQKALISTKKIISKVVSIE